MNTRHQLLALTGLFALTASAAAPVVSNVAVTTDDGTTVRVTYDLDKNAIVTVDFFVDGVALGDDRYETTVGEAFKPVEAGTGKVVKWLPYKEGYPAGTTLANVTAKVTAWDHDAPPPVMAVALNEPTCARFYPNVDRLPGGGLTNSLYLTTWMVFRRIPAAGVTWRMGTPLGEIDSSNAGWIANEYPHNVTFTADYYMAVYECTRAQWYCIRQKSGTSDVWTAGDNDTELLPIGLVNWCETHGYGNWPEVRTVGGFMEKLRTRTNNAFAFDLPTEAQWEYACRAGGGSPLPNGCNDRGDKNDTVCWYPGNSNDQRHKPGHWAHNGWGLYDMIGNVREWCLDTWSTSLTEAATDPVGPTEEGGGVATSAVERGGSYCSQWDWDSEGAWLQRSAHRSRLQRQWAYGEVGFRVAAPAVYAAPAE